MLLQVHLKIVPQIIGIRVKKWVWCGCLGLSLAGAMKSQTISIQHPELQYIFEDSLMQLIVYHDEFKPLDVSHAELLNHFPPSKPAFLFSYPTGNLQQSVVQITPVIDASGYADHTDHRLLYKFGQGVYMYGALNKRVGFEISAELLEQGFSSSSRFSLDSLRLIPGHNLILHG